MRIIITAPAATLISGCAVIPLEDPSEFQALSAEAIDGVAPDDIRVKGLQSFMPNAHWVAITPERRYTTSTAIQTATSGTESIASATRRGVCRRADTPYGLTVSAARPPASILTIERFAAWQAYSNIGSPVLVSSISADHGRENVSGSSTRKR